jgi:hypothetical protein
VFRESVRIIVFHHVVVCTTHTDDETCSSEEKKEKKTKLPGLSERLKLNEKQVMYSIREMNELFRFSANNPCAVKTNTSQRIVSCCESYSGYFG